ncbi:hypothetical protein EDD85DRAFT_1008580 [Armillaria nabsnona]|nr:hypothetical protein EDD85DRAFT_1008580 [Armillaria nabsnona]
MQWTGNESQNMEKLFLSVLDGSAWNEVVECSLSKLDKAWHTFHDKKAVFINLDIWQHFNIQKVHSTTHYTSMIQSHGTANGFNPEASEHLHIDFAKVAYNTSNKKDYVKQMTTWLRSRRYNELENDDVEGEEEDEDNIGAVGTEAEAVPAGQANNPVTSASIANNDESSNTDIVRATDTLQY